jgi:hypothetical protein
MTVLSELTKLTKLDQEEGEDQQAFLKRLFVKSNQLPDSDWGKLGQAAQLWVNKCIDAEQAGEAYPMVEGLEAQRRPATENVEEVTMEVQHTETTTPARTRRPVKSAKDKANGKKKAQSKREGRGRPAVFTPDAKIKVLSRQNPFRESSNNHKVFELYTPGMTVGQFEKALAKSKWKSTPKMFLSYHRGKGLIQVS